jgi:hypothetical protein
MLTRLFEFYASDLAVDSVRVRNHFVKAVKVLNFALLLRRA